MNKADQKYVLKLIDKDIEEQKKYLYSVEKILERFPNNQYWEKKKIALEKKIAFAIGIKIKFKYIITSHERQRDHSKAG